MKKIVYVLFAIMMFVISSTCISFADINIPNEANDDFMERVKSDLEGMVRSIELDEKIQFEVPMSEEVENYLIEKKDVKSYVRELYDFEKTGFGVKATLMEKEYKDDKLFLLYAVESEYMYVNDDSNETSGECVEIQVVIDLTTLKIVNIVERGDAYDEYIKNENSMENLSRIDFSTESIPSKQDIATKSDNYKKIISIQKKLEDEILINQDVEITSDAKASYTWLTGSKIKTWARNNFKKSQPSSGGKNVPYYDFSQISGNYDCTNFVSHALLAGGANVYKPSGATGISSKGWFYTNTSNRSSSWSGVANLHSFLTTNKTKGPAGTSSTYSSQAGTKAIGDIIQFYNGQTWRHSTVVTGLTTTSDGRNQAKVTGRSSKTMYNDNQLVGEIYEGYAKRTISALRTY